MPSGFNFGGAAPTPAGAPASTGGFSFGAAAAPAPAAAAPAAGGFSFGSAPAAPATATQTSTTTTTPAPSFGAASSATAPSGFGAPPATAPAAPSSSATTTVPDFDDAFPCLKIASKVEELLTKSAEVASDEGRLAGEELMHVLGWDTSSSSSSFGQILSKPSPLAWTKADPALRQKLQTDPRVSIQGKTASLTPSILKEILDLSDDLRISELQAMSLYAHASRPEVAARLEGRLERSFIDPALDPSSAAKGPPVLSHNTPKVARELYFFERQACLKTLHLILRDRLKKQDLIVAASDQLLQASLITNLVSLVQEWTQLADQLEQELHSKTSTMSSSLFGAPTPAPPTPHTQQRNTFAKVLLVFAYKQRYVAAECLFLIAYSTQCTPEEVAAILDLIQTITNGDARDAKSGLPLLDPVTDVPSAFYPMETPFAGGPGAGAPFTSAPPLQEKDPLAWKGELVQQVWNKGGKPQLLQCVSVLVVTAMCALDARHELLDRNTHQVNIFGRGNALLPPSSGVPVTTDQLLPIHQRLDARHKDAGNDWRRKDIWGVLMASYALLLRSLSSVASSPRLSPAASPRTGPIDIKATWRACLVRPVEFKSFTFARLSLLPSFPRHQASLNTHEFFVSVLSEFTSHYMEVMTASGNIPVSRSEWEKAEEEELEFRREQREEQRQFTAWSGQTLQEEDIPAQVDLLHRPDCMDDIISLATALCVAGPEYAQLFWSTRTLEGEDGSTGLQLVPSNALRELERSQEGDETLRPIYVSFLAALALAAAPDENERNGAEVVHQILSRESMSNAQVTWNSLMSAIRWYTRKMSPSLQNQGQPTSETSTSTTPSVASVASTAYYYGAEDNGIAGVSGFSSTQRTSSGSAASRPKEMGDLNNSILLSHLGVISVVARNLSSARSFLASMKLPIVGSDSSSIAGEDPVLTVLLVLSLAPLTPAVRGAVFSTVASLLSVSDASPDEVKTIKDMAGKGWELVEACRILPIAHLDQFPFQQDLSAQGMIFPPSSISLASSGSKGAWLPADQKYGIIYEMEHIESKTGNYPSTEGFLQLLTALFSTGGSPSYLGRETNRIRTGCTPYVEYVIHFVLPRILGSNRGTVALPFQLERDRSRLICRALETVQAVLSRYPVLSPGKALSVPSLVDETRSHQQVSELFGLPSLSAKLVVPPDTQDTSEIIQDFSSTLRGNSYNEMSQAGGISQTEQRAVLDSVGKTEASIHRAKSPGFTVLADLLSSDQGHIFTALVEILTEKGAEKGIRTVVGDQTYESLIADSLYGDTQPTIRSARAKDENSRSISKQSLLSRLMLPLELALNDNLDAVQWREQSIILALRLFCAAAAREDAFVLSVSAGRDLPTIVHVLHFDATKSFELRKMQVQVARLSDLLTQGLVTHTASQTDLVQSFVRYLRYRGSSISHDAAIASGSLAIVDHVSRSRSRLESLSALCGNSLKGQLFFAEAMARRLLISSQQSESAEEREIANLILDSILRTLRNPPAGEVNLAHILLGLPYLTPSGTWTNGSYKDGRKSSSEVGIVRDCFDTILELVSDRHFLADATTSHLAAKCFEIIFLLGDEWNVDDVGSLRRAPYAAERLRGANFWVESLLRFLGRTGTDSYSALHHAASAQEQGMHSELADSLHCTAWLLKGVSNELVASHRQTQGFFQVGWHESSHSEKILQVLFGDRYRLIMSLLRAAPLRGHVSVSASHVGNVPNSAKIKMAGAPDVVDGYEVIDLAAFRRLLPNPLLTDENRAAQKWAEDWNSTVAWDCASSHLSTSILMLLDSTLIFAGMRTGEGGSSSHLGAGVAQVALLNLQQLVDMLLEILGRFLDESESQSFSQVSSADRYLFPVASYNLSAMVLMLVEKMVSTREFLESANTSAGGTMIHICVLLSNAISLSASYPTGSLHAAKQHERTVLLGGALGLIVKALPKESSFDELKERVRPAATVLAKLASAAQGMDLRSRNLAALNYSSGATAELARLGFSALLDMHRESDQSSDDYFQGISSVFADSDRLDLRRELIESFVALIPALDLDICFILQKIAQCPGGGTLLLEAKVTNSLLEAADNYMREEERVKATLQHRSLSLETPPFFASHLSLVKTILASPAVPSHENTMLASHALLLLLRYTPVVDRLFESFPRESDVLLDCLECFSLAMSISGVKRWLETDGFSVWEMQILKLAYKVCEAPLPRRLLSALPLMLRPNERRSIHHSVVSVTAERSDRANWWDIIESANVDSSQMLELPDPPGPGAHTSNTFFVGGRHDRKKWTANKYADAVGGLQILDACLSFVSLRLRASAQFPMDWIALMRGLYHCSDVARASEGRLRSMEADGVSGLSIGGNKSLKNLKTIEKEFVAKLGFASGMCAEKLLGIVWSQIRSQRAPFELGHEDGLLDILTMLLDHTKMDEMGIGCIPLQPNDSNRRAATVEIAKSVRSMLCQLRK